MDFDNYLSGPSQSSSSQLSGLVCRVCSDPNGQPHYGTICCPSCKGFFRRVFLSEKTPECFRGNVCQIRRDIKGSRNICRACRFRKCTEVGMNTKDIRGKPDIIQEHRQPQQHQFSEESPKSSRLTTNQALEVAQIYVNLEKYCENNYVDVGVSKHEVDQLINQMLDSSVMELVLKRSPQCPRFKNEWKPFEMLTIENFIRSWSRSIVNCLDYSTRFPMFNSLSENDQKNWFISRMTPCTLLTMAYMTKNEMCEGLLFGCSNVFPLKEHQWKDVEDAHLRKLFKFITKALFSLVISSLHNLKFNDQQYSLLKACLFCSEGSSLVSISVRGTEIMKQEYKNNKTALINLLVNGSDDYEKQTEIIFKLEDIFSTLERLSVHIDQEFQYFHFLGLPIMKKKLLNELHFIN